MMSGTSVQDGDKLKTQWSMIRGVGGGIKFAPTAGYSGKTGDIVGIVTYKNQNGENLIRTVLQLTKLVGVTSKDFFESQGDVYVTIGGTNYRVAGDVECYAGVAGTYNDSGTWFTQGEAKDRVNAMKAFADTMAVYVDPIGKQVRVITAG